MSNSPVTSVDTGPQQVSCQVIVSAEARAIFDLVADPHRHPDLDGSGTVRVREVKGPDRLRVGAKFGVGMTMQPFGIPYAITSTCTAFEENRLVEWQHPMGHKWRWAFSAAGPGATTVTETFDYSTAKVPALIRLTGFDKKNEVGITKTLEALVERFAGNLES